jgi:hypothetical protein
MQDSTGHPQSRKAIAALFSGITYNLAAGRHCQDCEIIWMQPRGNERTAHDSCEHLVAKRLILDVLKVIAGIAGVVFWFMPLSTLTEVLLCVGSLNSKGRKRKAMDRQLQTRILLAARFFSHH